MSAKTRPPRARALRALLAFGALASCADNEASVYIRAIKQPTIVASACTVDNTLTNLRFEGTLDVALRRTYSLAPIIQNNIFARADPSSGRAESNDVTILGFIVELREDDPISGRLLSGAGINNPFTVYQTLAIPASSGATSTASTIFEVIPQQIGDLLYADICETRRGRVPVAGRPDCVPQYNTNVTTRVFASVQAFGRTRGGVSVLTPKFNYPITACCGCLRFFPAAMATGTGMMMTGPENPTCNAAATVLNAASCRDFFGQDVIVPCGLCSASNPGACQPFGHSTTGATNCPR